MSDAVDTLVMRKMIEKVGYPISAVTVWASGYQGIDIKGCRQRIATIREWAQSLGDRDVRRSYVKWLDHYDRGIDEAEREMQTHKMRIDQDNYQAERQREEDEVRSCKKIIPEPPV